MAENKSSMTIIVKNYGDTKLGDFDSPLWDTMYRFDTVRDNLLTYYQHQKHKIISDSRSHSVYDRLKWNHPRQSKPNNCFTYATGLISKGAQAFGPDCLDFVKLSNPKQQNRILTAEYCYKNAITPTSKEAMQSIMTSNGFSLFNTADEKLYETHDPIISMTGFVSIDFDLARDNYHFVRPLILYKQDKPQIIFRQKHGYDGPILPSMTIEGFFENHKNNERKGIFLGSPQVYLSDKSHIGRVITITQPDKEHFSLSLSAVKLG